MRDAKTVANSSGFMAPIGGPAWVGVFPEPRQGFPGFRQMAEDGRTRPSRPPHGSVEAPRSLARVFSRRPGVLRCGPEFLPSRSSSAIPRAGSVQPLHPRQSAGSFLGLAQLLSFFPLTFAYLPGHSAPSRLSSVMASCCGSSSTQSRGRSGAAIWRMLHHQDCSPHTIIVGSKGRAAHLAMNGLSPAIDCVESLISRFSSQATAEQGAQSFERQPDVQAQQALALHFLLPEAPQLLRLRVPGQTRAPGLPPTKSSSRPMKSWKP